MLKENHLEFTGNLKILYSGQKEVAVLQARSREVLPGQGMLILMRAALMTHPDSVPFHTERN